MKKKKYGAWGILIGFVLFISVIVAMIQHNNPLPDYRGSEGERQSETSTEVTSEVPEAEIIQYKNEIPSFTVNVPAGWTKITKNGYTTWIDKASATSFQIQIGASDSAILEVTKDTVASELAAAGAELVNFYWMDEWNFACMYRTFSESGSWANIEITAFNQKHIIRFVFIIDEKYYNQLEGTVGTIIDSFVWDRFAE